MGLLRPEDWQGRWITASHWFTPPEYRPPGFITAGGGLPDAPAWADVDLGQSMPIDMVRLYPHSPAQFPVRFRIEGSETLDYDQPLVITDCSAGDYRLPASGVAEFQARGVNARYVRLLVVRSPESGKGSHHYQSAVRQMEILSGGRNVALMKRTREFGTNWNAGHATALVDGMPSQNEGNICPPDACPLTAAPLLRKSFRLDAPVRRATLHFAVLGMADVTINGRNTGSEVLGPPFTDYSKRVIYLTRDVTGLLRQGENVIGATLGNGFFGTPAAGSASGITATVRPACWHNWRSNPPTVAAVPWPRMRRGNGRGVPLFSMMCGKDTAKTGIWHCQVGISRVSPPPVGGPYL